MKKIKRKLLIGASSLMFVGSMFAFSSSVHANVRPDCDKALYGNEAGTAFCCAGTGGGCGAADC